MSKKLKIILGVVLISVTTLYAADSRMGTEDDPIVTKSYVDEVVKSLNNSEDISTLEKRLETSEQLITMLSEEIQTLKEEGSEGFEIVKVEAGSTLFGKQGSEMIIRSGEGKIIASTGGGIQDVTDGTDLMGGIAPKNNMLIVPREDNRGIEAVKTMIVMVRGGYTIK